MAVNGKRNFNFLFWGGEKFFSIRFFVFKHSVPEKQKKHFALSLLLFKCARMTPLKLELEERKASRLLSPSLRAVWHSRNEESTVGKS